MELYFNRPFLSKIYDTFGDYFQQVHRNILIGGTGANKNDKVEASVKVYNDAMINTTVVSVEPQFITFCSQGFLNILDKLNIVSWNNQYPDFEQFKLLINTLIHGNEAQRNSALDKFVSLGLLLESDVLSSKQIVSSCFNFKPELVSASMNDQEGYYSFSYNTPVTLFKKYSNIRNPEKEKLYLLFMGRGPTTNGYSPVAGETFGHLASYRNDALNNYSYCTGYIAVDMSEVGGDQEGAIRYDHLDIIEVIDNMRFQINVPAKIVA